MWIIRSVRYLIPALMLAATAWTGSAWAVTPAQEEALLTFQKQSADAYYFGYQQGSCDPSHADHALSVEQRQALKAYPGLCRIGTQDKREGRGGKAEDLISATDEYLGVLALRTKNFKSAYKLLEYAAKDGRAMPQVLLGMMYRDGAGGQKDCHKAVHWLGLAADGGNVDGQYNLGVMYDEGKCAKQDYNKAYRLYAKAAAQKKPEAWYNIGVMMFKGEGMQTDRVGAYVHWRVASILGADYATALLKKISFTREERAEGEKRLKQVLQKLH